MSTIDCDIKSKNIIVQKATNSTVNARLIDFGLSIKPGEYEISLRMKIDDGLIDVSLDSDSDVTD